MIHSFILFFPLHSPPAHLRQLPSILDSTFQLLNSEAADSLSTTFLCYLERGGNVWISIAVKNGTLRLPEQRMLARKGHSC